MNLKSNLTRKGNPILVLFSLIFYFTCNGYSTTLSEMRIPDEQNRIEFKGAPSDFLEFITKFISDSSYQLDHINFPLSNFGMDIPAPGKKNWKFLNDTQIFIGKREVNSSLLEGGFEVINENEISYGVGLPESEWDYYLIFRNLKNKWFLTDYLDYNMLPHNSLIEIDDLNENNNQNQSSFKSKFNKGFKGSYLYVAISLGAIIGLKKRVQDRRFKSGHREIPLTGTEFFKILFYSAIITSIFALTYSIII